VTHDPRVTTCVTRVSAFRAPVSIRADGVILGRTAHRAVSRPPSAKELNVLLVIAIILLIVFAGLGFAAHVLWLGLILAVIIGIAHVLTGGRRV
jgi:hypothetical protein